MVNICKYYLFLSVVALVILRLISCDFIYKSLNGNLDSQGGINVSLMTESFKGIVIYAIDSNNKFLVELESERGENKIIIKFNRFTISKSSKIICGCSTCSDVFMTISLKISQLNLTIECNNLHNYIPLITKYKWPDLFAGYPSPKNFSNSTNTTFFWMGNVGPYYGDKDMLFLPLKNQFKGCIVKLYFQNKLVNITESSTHVRNTCNTYICRNKPFDSNFSSIMNFTKPSREKQSNTGQTISLPINKQNTSLIILKWQQTLSTNFTCQTLMEIQFKNNVTMVFQTNNSSRLIMTNYKSGQIKCQRTMAIELNEATYKLLVKFDNNNIVTGMFNNLNQTLDLKMLTEDVYEDPFRINFGHSKLSNCGKFDGIIDLETFQIEISGFWIQIKQMIEPYGWIILMSVILVTVLIIITTIILNVNIENCKVKINTNPIDSVEMESVNRSSQFTNKQIVNISLPTNESSIYEYIPDS